MLMMSGSDAQSARSKTSPRRPLPAPVRPISQSHLSNDDEQPDGDADASAVKGSSASNEYGSAAGFAKGQPEEDFGSSGAANGFGAAAPAAPAGSGSGFFKNEEESAAEAGHPAPEPYSFSYSADTDDGASSTREETGDKDGTITGMFQPSFFKNPILKKLIFLINWIRISFKMPQVSTC
jgi:hypothetical protein